MHEDIFTDDVCDQQSDWNIIEKLYQLQHEKDSLKEENVKLQGQLESAEETIKDCYSRLITLTNEANSFSEAVMERNNLLEQLDDSHSKYVALKELHEKQIHHSHLCETELQRARENNLGLLEKITALEKTLLDKSSQLSELVDVIHDYENVLDQRQSVIQTRDNEITKLNQEAMKLRSQLRDWEEHWEIIQQNTSNINPGDNAHNLLKGACIRPHQHTPHFRENGVPNPLPLNSTNLSQSTPLIRIHSPAVLIQQKSLADEISEVNSQASDTSGGPETEQTTNLNEVGIQTEQGEKSTSEEVPDKCTDLNSLLQDVLKALHYITLEITRGESASIALSIPEFKGLSVLKRSKLEPNDSCSFQPPTVWLCEQINAQLETIISSLSGNRKSTQKYPASEDENCKSAARWVSEPTLYFVKQPDDIKIGAVEFISASGLGNNRGDIPDSVLSTTSALKQAIPSLIAQNCRIPYWRTNGKISSEELICALKMEMQEFELAHRRKKSENFLQEFIMNRELNQLQNMMLELGLFMENLNHFVQLGQTDEAKSRTCNSKKTNDIQLNYDEWKLIVSHFENLFTRILDHIDLIESQSTMCNIQPDQTTRLAQMYQVLDNQVCLSTRNALQLFDSILQNPRSVMTQTDETIVQLLSKMSKGTSTCPIVQNNGERPDLLRPNSPYSIPVPLKSGPLLSIQVNSSWISYIRDFFQKITFGEAFLTVKKCRENIIKRVGDRKCLFKTLLQLSCSLGANSCHDRNNYVTSIRCKLTMLALTLFTVGLLASGYSDGRKSVFTLWPSSKKEVERTDFEKSHSVSLLFDPVGWLYSNFLASGVKLLHPYGPPPV